MPGTRITPEQLIQLPEIEKTLHKQNTSYFTLSSSLIDGPKEIYLNGTKEEEGSYLWLKSQITEELKYADHIFKFDDDTKKISCYSPIYSITSDNLLVSAINTALESIYLQPSWRYVYEPPKAVYVNEIMGFVLSPCRLFPDS
jgi:hypothetical protein